MPWPVVVLDGKQGARIEQQASRLLQAAGPSFAASLPANIQCGIFSAIDNGLRVACSSGCPYFALFLRFVYKGLSYINHFRNFRIQ